MSAGYSIETALRLVLTRAWGTLTAADFLGHAQSLGLDPAFDPTYHQLLDLRDVTALDFPTSTIREMAYQSPFRSGARRAIVVNSDAMYGLARMFQTLREPVADHIAVFRDLPSALDWLGLTDNADRVVAALNTAKPVQP